MLSFCESRQVKMNNLQITVRSLRKSFHHSPKSLRTRCFFVFVCRVSSHNKPITNYDNALFENHWGPHQQLIWTPSRNSCKRLYTTTPRWGFQVLRLVQKQLKTCRSPPGVTHASITRGSNRRTAAGAFFELLQACFFWGGGRGRKQECV